MMPIEYLSPTGKYLSLIPPGKPPALPGDSQSLTIPGINWICFLLNRSKFKEKKGYLENGHYTTTNIESQCMGMQVSYCMDTKI
jgi:hypothetical protein